MNTLTSKKTAPAVVMMYVFLIVMSSLLNARTIDVNTARTVARHFYWDNCMDGKSFSFDDIIPVLAHMEVMNGDTLYYIFNYQANNGFIIVAAQEASYPVIGYADQGFLDPNDPDPSPEFSWWMARCAAQIQFAIDHQVQPTQEISQFWAYLQTKPSQPVSKSVVNPFVTTTWAQGCNYNNSCPVMTGGPCGRGLVGCVAVAMGQALKYYDRPIRGNGSASYTHATLGTISATFNLDYDWDNMPNSLTTTTTDVDELLFHCGVSVNMNYGTGSSGAWPYNNSVVADAFKDHFYIKSGCINKLRTSYTASAWSDLIRTEILAYRPVIYGGGSGSAHAWVIDGVNDNYNSTGNRYFHCNWGWSGSYDGWFLITDLTPGSYDFNALEEIVTGIEPKTSNLTYWGPDNMTFTNNNLYINCRVWNNGDAPSAPHSVAYYLSTNTIISNSDILFGTDLVGVLTPSFSSPENISKSIYLSNEAVYPGVYYVGYFIDYLYEESNESSESDNTWYFPSTITVNCQEPGLVTASDAVYIDRVYVSWSSVLGASYYRVYRNTTNSTSGASALSGWQTGTNYSDYTALPGITYYYFIKAATNSSGGYASDYSVGDGGAILIELLADDSYQNVSVNPNYFYINNSSSYWYAVGIRPSLSSEDWDINMYSDATMTTQLAYSYQGTGRVDVIVVDGNHTPVANKYVKASRYSGTSSAVIEYENAEDLITVGSKYSDTWSSSDVVEIWDIYLTAGTYVFDLDIVSAGADLDFALYKSNGAAYHIGRYGAVASSATFTNGVDEQFTYTVTTADYYGLCVWSNNGVSTGFNISVNAAGQWLGLVSHDWHTPGNWNGGLVPDASIDVTISTGYVYYPKLSTAHGACDNLTLNSGARLDIEGYDLVVSGNTRIYGDLRLTHADADLNVTGFFYFESGSTASMVTSSQVRVDGLFWFKNGANVQLTAGEFIFQGTTPSSVYGDDRDCNLYHVRFNKTNATVTNYSLDTLFIHGNIYFANACTLNIHSSSDPFVLRGNIQNTGGGVMQLDYGDFIMTGNSNTSTLQTGDYFNNLILGLSGSKVSYHTKSFNSSVTVNGNLTIQSCILNPNDNTLYIGGNWANYLGSSGFTEGTGAVHFVGANAADIMTEETFYDVVLNKTYIDFEGLEVTGSVNITNNLSIIDGTLEMNSPCTLNIGKSVTISNGAGLNANDYGSILINVGNDWTDYNPTSSYTNGFECGDWSSMVRFNGDGNAKGYQAIYSQNPFRRLYIATTATTVYPTAFPLHCADLVVESGVLENYHRNIHVTDSAVIYGDLLMVFPEDTMFVNHIIWQPGSGGTITEGAFVVGFKWEFLDGTDVSIGSGNDVIMRGTSGSPSVIVNYDDDATFGNLILDKPAPAANYAFLSATDTVRVAGNFILEANNKFKTYGCDMRVKGTVDMDATSKIYDIWSTGTLEIDGNFYQKGEIAMSAGKVLVHGNYGLSLTGVLRIDGGSFVCDQPYAASKAWQYLSGKMVMSGGVFELSNNSMHVNSIFVDSISGGDIRIGYTFYAPSAGTFNPTGGTVEMISGDKMVDAYVQLGSANWFHDFTYNSPGVSRVLFSDININHDFLLQAGVLNTGTPFSLTGYDIFVKGDWTNLVGDTGFVENTASVHFVGSEPSFINTPETFYNLVLNKTHAGFDGLQYMDGDSISVLNDLTLTDGTFELNDYTKMYVGGDITLASGAGLNANDESPHIYSDGSWTNNNATFNNLWGFNPGLSSHVIFNLPDTAYLTSAAAEEVFCNLSFTGNYVGPGHYFFFLNNGMQVIGDYHSNRAVVRAQGDLVFYGDYRDEFYSQLVTPGNAWFTGNRNQYLDIKTWPNLDADSVFVDKSPSKTLTGNPLQLDDFGQVLNLPKSWETGDTVFIDDYFNFHSYGGAGLVIRDGVVEVGEEAISIVGDCEIHDGAVLRVGVGGRVFAQAGSGKVLSGGRFQSIGSADSNATVQFVNDFDLNIKPGGIISTSYTEYSLCCDSGIYISSGGIIDPIHPFTNCTFTPDTIIMAGSALNRLLTINNNQSLIIENAQFHDNPNYPSSVFNVAKTVNAGMVYFKSATGSLAGESYDIDIFNRIIWTDSLSLTMMPALTICAGDTARLWGKPAGGLTPYAYTWSGGAGILNPGDSLALAVPATTTTYTLKVGDQFGDYVTGSVLVTVNPLPAVSASATPPVLCAGQSSILTASGASTYAWSHGLGAGASKTVIPAVTTTYTVTGTDANGCTNTATVTVTVNALPTVGASAAPSTICVGESSILSASGASTYAWSHGLGTGSSKTVTPAATTTYTVTGTAANGCTNTATVTVTVNALPTVGASAAPSTICVGESSILSASGASTYAWSHGLGTGSSKTVMPAATTTYTVTGTAANGCTNTATVKVTVNALPTVTAVAVPVTICAGESSVLTASGASTYAWSHGLGTGASKTVIPAATTTYTVTGTAANGCTNTATVTVTVNALPTVSASAAPSTICAGESSVLTASGASTYAWSHGLGTGASKTVMPATTTTYTVTGTAANGCTNTATVTVTVNALPTVSASAAPSTICAGESSVLTASGASTYAWSHGLGTGASKTVMPATTTTYTVTGTAANGCTNTATVTVTVNALPTVSASAAPSTICAGESSVLTASGASTYAWSHGLGTGASKTVMPATTTTYTVTGTAANGCTNTATVTVTVNALPTVGASAAPSTICAGESSVLTASGASTYAWSHGLGTGSSKTVTPAATTTYTVTGTAANGCTNTATVTVTVNALPTVGASAAPSTICAGESSVLTASGASTYAWSHGLGTGSSKTVTPAATTTYTVTGTAANGCTNTATVTVTVNALPTVGASAAPATICAGESSVLTASGASTYAWSHGLGTGTSKTVTPATTTTYTVTGTAANGCTNTATVTVTVNALPTVSASAAPSTICAGESSVLTASGASTYTWSHGLGTGASKTVMPAATTTYTVTGTAVNGCTNTATVTVTVNALPTVSASAAPSTICAGESSVLTASGASTYAWSHGLGTGASKTVMPATTTTYTVTGTAANGCTNTATVTVTVNALPTVSASAAPSTICAGESSVLTASGAITYTWSHGLGTGASKTVMPATTTTYTVTGSAANGCTNTVTVTVTVNALPVVIATATPDSILPGQSSTLQASGAAIYSWNMGLGAGATHIVNPLITTTYTVTGTSAAGCNSTASVTVFITVPTAMVSGWVKYANTAFSPMHSTDVMLKLPAGPVVAQDQTDGSGYFEMPYVPAGLYHMDMTTTIPWGGGNALDALLIMRHFVSLDTLTGMQLQASDVNVDGATNASDAMLVAMRFVDSIAGFTAGDFLFDHPDTLITDGVTNIQHTSLGLCFGDVNASYVPGSKASNAVPVLREGQFYVNNRKVEVPLYLDGDRHLGAISMIIEMPNRIAGMASIRLNTGAGTQVATLAQDAQRMAWFAVDGWTVSTQTPFAFLTLDLTNETQHTLSQEPYLSEIQLEVASPQGNLLPVKNLRMPELIFSSKTESSFGVYPNPFYDELRLWMNNPEPGQLTVVFHDVNGRELESGTPVHKEAGYQIMNLNTEHYPAGIYFLHIHWEGKNANHRDVLRIIKQ